MPPKKGKKGKKKKKVKEVEVDDPKFDYNPPDDFEEEYVKLNIRLISWTYLDFVFVSTFYLYFLEFKLFLFLLLL
jgi:hypothetical protein